MRRALALAMFVLCINQASAGDKKPMTPERVGQLLTILRSDLNEDNRTHAAEELGKVDGSHYPEIIPLLIETDALSTPKLRPFACLKWSILSQRFDPSTKKPAKRSKPPRKMARSRFAGTRELQPAFITMRDIKNRRRRLPRRHRSRCRRRTPVRSLCNPPHPADGSPT